jgi:hypothetical protein
LSRTAVTPWSRVLGKKFPESHLIPEPEVRCSVFVAKYNSGDQIKKKGMGGHVAHVGKRSTYRIWWKIRRRWDISEIDLEEEIEDRELFYIFLTCILL